MTTRVVIVGGGFGGLAATRGLARASVDVTLVDRTNYHLFQPLLYQVATAGLSPAEIAYPIRRILRRQRNARVLLGEALAIDPAAKRVRLADGDVGYDFLVLAAGAGSLVLREGRVGSSCARAEDAGGRARDPPAGPRRLRGRGARGGHRGPPAVAHVRRDRRGADRGRDGGGVRRGRAPLPRARLPPDRPADGPRHPAGGRARGCCPPSPRSCRRKRSSSSRRSGCRSGPARSVTAVDAGGVRSEPTASPRAPSCGRPASRPRRSPARSACRSTGPAACAWRRT